MQIPLPNLDDRRWADLVEEGRALIPVLAPEWTDHNIHDPGITLIELFAWLAETGVYRINRIPDRYKRKFLALLGTHPLPPRPARSFLRLELAEGAEPLSLPATLEFAADSAAGVRTRFRTIESITLASNRLRAIQLRRGSGYENLTERWQRGESFGAFGDMPQSGAELYLGFDRPLPVNAPVILFFSFAGSRSGIEERRRLLLETQSLENATPPPAFDDPARHGRGGHDPALVSHLRRQQSRRSPRRMAAPRPAPGLSADRGVTTRAAGGQPVAPLEGAGRGSSSIDAIAGHSPGCTVARYGDRGGSRSMSRRWAFPIAW